MDEKTQNTKIDSVDDLVEKTKKIKIKEPKPVKEKVDPINHPGKQLKGSIEAREKMAYVRSLKKTKEK